MICDETIRDLIHLIKSTLSAPQTTSYIARINFYLLHLALLLFEKYGVEKTDVHKNSHHLLAIEKGIRYLDKHFTEQISVEDIAEYVGYSSSHLRHCFKEITGYTFTTYLNMQRIKYARTLLQSSDMSIEEIALLSGFHSPTYFSSTYKKYIGVSPSNEKQSETCAARRTII